MSIAKYDFSNWIKWTDSEQMNQIPSYSGVYCIAISNSSLTNQPFEWIKDIIYIGMTNESKFGLKRRLKYFDASVRGKKGHSGAKKIYKSWQWDHAKKTIEEIREMLFVSYQVFEYDTEKINPLEYKLKGEVTKHEYVCFAEYIEKFGELPKFNQPLIELAPVPWILNKYPPRFKQLFGRTRKIKES